VPVQPEREPLAQHHSDQLRKDGSVDGRGARIYRLQPTGCIEIDEDLDGQPIEAFSGLIPPGTYDELEFEIEDLEDDEEDTQFAAEIEALREAIQDEFPDWPRKATALVVGSFDAVGGGSTDFRVYIEAEIEIERALQPPLVVDVDGASSSALTVDIRPDLWFARSDGSVLNLSLYDYDETGQVLEFELEMEEGFLEIEIENN